jgi:LmbE family N-acetylglucosaminyl deacetylase
MVDPFTRREILTGPGLLAGAAVVGLPLAAAAEDDKPAARPKLKVVVAGAHPDDPESGCGGTMARYSDQGHEVVALYLTRGEAGIRGKSPQQAATIRTAECEKACAILNARPLFAGQIDGSTEVNPARYEALQKLLSAEKPDLVFTHWPIDTHRDHRAISLLVYDAWLKAGKKFALFYFEVMSGSQTQHFPPTHYVDITQTEARKREACMAHASQNPAGFYKHHEAMNHFRGLESGFKLAEAFSRHIASPTDKALGLGG